MSFMQLPLIAFLLSLGLFTGQVPTPNAIPAVSENTKEMLKRPKALKYEEVEWNCVVMQSKTPVKLVSDQETLDQIMAKIKKANPDLPCEAPVVDFEKYDLILASSSASGCSFPTIQNRTLTLNRESNRIAYSVNLVQNGYCKMLHIVPLVVKVPKTEGVTEVDLTVSRTYSAE